MLFRTNDINSKTNYNCTHLFNLDASDDWNDPCKVHDFGILLRFIAKDGKLNGIFKWSSIAGLDKLVIKSMLAQMNPKYKKRVIRHRVNYVSQLIITTTNLYFKFTLGSK